MTGAMWNQCEEQATESFKGDFIMDQYRVPGWEYFSSGGGHLNIILKFIWIQKWTIFAKEM